MHIGPSIGLKPSVTAELDAITSVIVSYASQFAHSIKSNAGYWIVGKVAARYKYSF